MRWPWQRDAPAGSDDVRGHAGSDRGDGGHGAGADGADARAGGARAAGADVQRATEAAPSAAGWAFVPPLQRSFAAMPLVSGVDTARHGLAAWGDPTSLRPMSHLVSTDVAAGVVDGDGRGLGATAPPHPHSPPSAEPPTLRTTDLLAPSPSGGTAAPHVQRSAVPSALHPARPPAPLVSAGSLDLPLLRVATLPDPPAAVRERDDRSVDDAGSRAAAPRVGDDDGPAPSAADPGGPTDASAVPSDDGVPVLGATEVGTPALGASVLGSPALGAPGADADRGPDTTAGASAAEIARAAAAAGSTSVPLTLSGGPPAAAVQRASAAAESSAVEGAAAEGAAAEGGAVRGGAGAVAAPTASGAMSAPGASSPIQREGFSTQRAALGTGPDAAAVQRDAGSSTSAGNASAALPRASVPRRLGLGAPLTGPVPSRDFSDLPTRTTGPAAALQRAHGHDTTPGAAGHVGSTPSGAGLVPGPGSAGAALPLVAPELLAESGAVGRGSGDVDRGSADTGASVDGPAPIDVMRSAESGAPVGSGPPGNCSGSDSAAGGASHDGDGGAGVAEGGASDAGAFRGGTAGGDLGDDGPVGHGPVTAAADLGVGPHAHAGAADTVVAPGPVVARAVELPLAPGSSDDGASADGASGEPLSALPSLGRPGRPDVVAPEPTRPGAGRTPSGTAGSSSGGAGGPHALPVVSRSATTVASSPDGSAGGGSPATASAMPALDASSPGGMPASERTVSPDAAASPPDPVLLALPDLGTTPTSDSGPTVSRTPDGANEPGLILRSTDGAAGSGPVVSRWADATTAPDAVLSRAIGRTAGPGPVLSRTTAGAASPAAGMPLTATVVSRSAAGTGTGNPPSVTSPSTRPMSPPAASTSLLTAASPLPGADSPLTVARSTAPTSGTAPASALALAIPTAQRTSDGGPGGSAPRTAPLVGVLPAGPSTAPLGAAALQRTAAARPAGDVAASSGTRSGPESSTTPLPLPTTAGSTAATTSPDAPPVDLPLDVRHSPDVQRTTAVPQPAAVPQALDVPDVQRAAEAPAEPAPPPATPAAAPGAASPTTPEATSPEQLDALVRRLVGPLTRQLRADLLLDRERRGRRTDAR
ncbi:hypothetical protein [Cellulomonas cellasea]|uniref:Syndecan 1 n=1 Tax=Cellulomonas cellasea TaxID=43670 RepID=A0A7W4UH26_9CELL|nr:hypothetical protein [Cellulomonas cellasea]MBB2924043.1 hypothetical protein [Cellulomonas cellasea]